MALLDLGALGLLLRAKAASSAQEDVESLRKGVGRIRKNRCDLGSTRAGDDPFEYVWSPLTIGTTICEGGIHGASRCILPRTFIGMFNATARA